MTRAVSPNACANAAPETKVDESAAPRRIFFIFMRFMFMRGSPMRTTGPARLNARRRAPLTSRGVLARPCHRDLELPPKDRPDLARLRLAERVRRYFIHVARLGHFELDRVHAARRVAECAGDVAALEAPVQHRAESRMPL